MKRLLIFLLALGLLASAGFARTYYIPHVAGSSAWTTVLAFNHTGGFDPAKADVELYDADGAIVATLVVTLTPGESRQYMLRDYGAVAGKVFCPADFVSVRLGFMASEASGGGTAEFNLPSELTDAAALNLPEYYDELTWSGYALFNGSDETVTVFPHFYRTDGGEDYGYAFDLEPRCKRVAYFDDELGVDFTNLSSVIFETETKSLTAIIISGNENEKLLFTKSDENQASWEVVDRYTPTEGAGFATFYPVGQATTPDYVLYAVSSGEGYGFNNLVKCFDRADGSLVWQTDLASGVAGRGLAVSASGDYVYYYGVLPTSGSTNYQVYCLNAETGALVNGAYYSNAGEFPSEERIRNQIHVASLVDTVVVVYQAPDGVHRHLYDETMLTEHSSHTWAGLETVLTDLGGSGSSYLMLRTDWNAADSVYNQMVLWAFPYNNLAGGGIFEELTNLRGTGRANHVFGEGLYVDEEKVYLALKVCAGDPYGGDLRHLGQSVVDLAAAYFDLTDNHLYAGFLNYDRSSIMDASVSTFMGPDNEIYMGVSGIHKSCILQPQYTQSRGYDYTFDNLHCVGNSLYMVSFHVELGALNGSTAEHVVRVRKIPFTEFFCKALQ